jgi:hypothetical protein
MTVPGPTWHSVSVLSLDSILMASPLIVAYVTTW